MTTLVLGSVFFLGIHLIVGGSPLRRAAVRALGEDRYRGLFSLFSVAGLVLIVLGYRAAPATEPLYTLGHWAQVQTTPVVLVALLFIALAFATPSPTSAGQEKLLSQDVRPQGLHHITRHPFLWGISLWSGSHLLANGDVASLILFGTLLVTSLMGTVLIDTRRRRDFGADWQRYARHTSNLPFAALLTGRTRLVAHEISWKALGVAIVLYIVFYLGHGWLFGAPLPPHAVP